ncbi:hypothetical protein V494_08160 [Pseudogymnoascus sp. VKM F-4513 (FW-928)]|nr:hypothetical protein V494_08160 [Pseudogymnoascus sp. VKM F-4513 (FW-928)]
MVNPRIPIIGHLIGMIFGKQDFYYQLGQQNPDLPIFTLPLGLGKMYIITSPALVQAAMRKKTLSFEPLTVAFAERMVGFGPNIVDLMHNPPKDGSMKWLDTQHKPYDMLAPGAALNDMNARVLNSVADILNAVGPEFETKHFYLWLRKAFTHATTSALFGAHNPLTEDPKLNDSLWDYEGGQADLLMKPFPSITAQKPLNGRKAIQKALRAYMRAGHYEDSDVSMVIKDRVAVNKKWGLPMDDIADHELGMLFVSITNAIPTLFWVIFYVFRDSQLVADLQKELLECLEEKKDSNGQRECIFSVSKFSAECPLLVSTYQEVMRMTNRQLGTRTVIEDTLLSHSSVGDADGTPTTYLLKKGTHIQMPTIITAYAPETWGKDVDSFNPRRFITTREQERLQNRAFNPFGGGKHLCPGRHFAYAEILGAVAALVLGFEIETPEGGKVNIPPMGNSLVEAVAKPLPEAQQTLLANIRRRPGWEGVKWRFVAGNGKTEA